MIFVGVDFGGARIGLATGENSHQVCTPFAPLKASGKLRVDAQEIVRFAKRHEASLIVLGLPLQPDGSETKLCGVIRQLGGEIQKLGQNVSYQNEAYSTVDASIELEQLGLAARAKRQAIDSAAACQILMRYFQEHA